MIRPDFLSDGWSPRRAGPCRPDTLLDLVARANLNPETHHDIRASDCP
jgi:hypothetical protein